MKLNNVVLLLAPLFSIIGCAQESRTLIPADNTGWVYVEIKAPLNTQAVPLNALYTSDECKKTKYNSDMEEYKTKGTHVNYVKMERDSSSGNYKSQIPLNDSGQCKWTLSQLTLGIEYSDTEHLVSNAKIGTAAGVIVAFDGVEREKGNYHTVGDQISSSPKYYPLIKERNIIDKGVFLSLFGKSTFELYKVQPNNKSNVMIKFSPVLEESKVVKMIGPKIKKLRGALENRISLTAQ